MKKQRRDRAARSSKSEAVGQAENAPLAIGRREFVRASGIIVVATLGSACSVMGAEGSGTVLVGIAGLQGPVASAGAATISGGTLTEPLAVVLQGSAVAQQEVPVGRYNVQYSPPAGYTMAAGSSSLLQVDVILGQTTEVLFQVVLATGSVRVSVSGLTAGAPSGGTGQITRTDLPGQPSLAYTVPTSGTVAIAVATGTYNVTFVPPAAFQLASGQGGPRTVVVSAAVEIAAVFVVEASVVPSGIVFHSDWSTATGTGNDAILDTSKQIPWNFRGAGLEVVSAAGLGFPTSNCLRVPWANGIFNFVRRSGLPIPAVGASRWYRWYMRLTIPDGVADGQSHPFQDGYAAPDTNWMFLTLHNTGGTRKFGMQLWAGNGRQAFPSNNWVGPVLDKDVTYRYEMQFARLTSSTYNLHIRIYNPADSLVADDSNFRNETNPSTLAGTPTFLNLDPSKLDGFNAGVNDPGNEPSTYAYQGAIAISDSGWVGPYAGGV